VGGDTNTQSKLAFSDINRNRRPALSPRSPRAGVFGELMKIPKTQLKNRQKCRSFGFCLKHI